ncbi:hypothetical protein AVEN_37049-1 [Araneus ventricosus]|uniref:Uncharacterized protein n=1 Tax=Araneus ventricosus TaxID=182803 RepID=A0A4Y2SXZ2_ARAVE|nr:hypothetical protein AVEN_37049-1 [Araneus ventricosus]
MNWILPAWVVIYPRHPPAVKTTSPDHLRPPPHKANRLRQALRRVKAEIFRPPGPPRLRYERRLIPDSTFSSSSAQARLFWKTRHGWTLPTWVVICPTPPLL